MAKNKELNMRDKNYVQRMRDDNMCELLVETIMSRLQGHVKYAKYFTTTQGVMYLDLFDGKGKLVKGIKLTDFSCEENLNKKSLSNNVAADNVALLKTVRNAWFEFLDISYPTFKQDYLNHKQSIKNITIA